MQSSRRAFLQQTGAGALALAAAGWSRQASAAERPPNIVFMLIDDMGWPDLGCYGNAYHETPRIDAFAKEGIRFTDAYAACPVCSPTRASIMSGQYPAHVGITDFIPGHWRPHAPLLVPRNRTQHLPHEVDALPELLGKAGYVSGHFGKWHLGQEGSMPTDHGFDESIVSYGWTHFGNPTEPEQGYTKDDYLAEELAKEAVDFMTRHKDQPFFVHLSQWAVHIPLEAREALIEKYKNKPGEPGRINNPIYAAMVEHVDQSVGVVLDALEKLGLAENTMVVLFSDNGGLHTRFDGEGEFVSTNAPLHGEKGALYEGGIRVPLMVRWPRKIKPGQESAVPVSSVDFLPTFSALAGAPMASQQVDGANLLPLFQRGQAPDRDALYWHYPHYHHSTPSGAIRKDGWKLIEYFEHGRLELFNLERDPSERHDLASIFPEKAHELRDQLAAWRDSIGAAMPTPNPDYDPARAHEWGVYTPPGEGDS